MADIGLIGLPNTGKSTLLSRLSGARPKIGRYPFTTTVPNLGVMVCEDERRLVLADIPGLIEGASQGKGLGLRFLKHLERTGLLLHLLDITYQPARGILEDFETLQGEMLAFNPLLAKKPQLVLINKMDLYKQGEHRDIRRLRKSLHHAGYDSVPISALTAEGLGRVKRMVAGYNFTKDQNNVSGEFHANG
jgi:GTP-binding protein